MSMSPYGLVQERVSRDLHFPWRVLVCCAFMTRTTKEQARPALSAFFATYGEPGAFWKGSGGESPPAFMRSLGLVSRRWDALTVMTDQYLDRVSPYECFGAGEYARDALDLFCAGRILLSPSDHYLKRYSGWRLSGGARIEWDEAGYLGFVVAKAQQ